MASIATSPEVFHSRVLAGLLPPPADICIVAGTYIAAVIATIMGRSCANQY
jgi:hypothetical protein